MLKPEEVTQAIQKEIQKYTSSCAAPCPSRKNCATVFKPAELLKKMGAV